MHTKLDHTSYNSRPMAKTSVMQQQSRLADYGFRVLFTEVNPIQLSRGRIGISCNHWPPPSLLGHRRVHYATTGHAPHMRQR
jgi:hypothetical protein